MITGAAGGQGAAEAELFLREEGSVVLTDIDAAAGEALAKRLGGGAGEVLSLRQDVADEASWQETVAAALARFGKLHILVNNAGTIARQGMRQYHRRGMEPHLGGQPDRRDARHEALRAGGIVTGGGGSIINISSTAGLTAHDDAAYTRASGGCAG